MIKSSSIFACVLLGSLTACDSGSNDPDPVPCPSGNCGQESFRRAVPKLTQVRLASPTGSNARTQRRDGSVVSTSRGHVSQLEALAPAIPVIQDHVDELNLVIDDVFGDLDDMIATTPEVESDAMHQWRLPSELAGKDDLLLLTTSDGVHFDLAAYTVGTGAGVEGASPILHGDVETSDADHLDFHLTIDLDVASAVEPQLDAQGDIVIAAMPLADGDGEVWYDYHAVSINGSPVETSRTTAWAWSDTSEGLEFLVDVEGVQATVYARWDEGGGRYDHHLAYNDVDLGPVDEIATDCWAAGGAEEFTAWAVIDSGASYYGELDGQEAACEFGPVEDHPSPGEDFIDLPADGEWELLELLSWCSVSSSC